MSSMNQGASDALHPERCLFDLDPFSVPGWVEVLVDCPGAQKLYTYQVPAGITTQPGDIVNVPFGSQIASGIVIHCLSRLTPDLRPERMRSLQMVVASGLFPPYFWPLLHRTAAYYGCALTEVIRAALPPGILARSQRRVRLKPEQIPVDRVRLCSPPAQTILQLLRAQKAGHYSVHYLTSHVQQGQLGLRELLRHGWIESYLALPRPVQPKRRLAASLVADPRSPQLSQRHREILLVLQQQGGEMWLSELIQQARTSHGTLKRLETAKALTIQPREILRLERGLAQQQEAPQALTPQQTEALQVIYGLSKFAQVLLHGVTGSGKTEVYLQAIAPRLVQGQSALVLVPEIGLTPQLTDRFRARFGDCICVYHSGLSAGERYDTWRQMLTGQPQIVIGTRSAVFAPLPNLGLIVLDEEHDASFKQSRPAPTYHARQVAQWLAQLQNCPLILGSATPALETWVALRQGSDQRLNQGSNQGSSLVSTPVGQVGIDQMAATETDYYLALPERIQARPMPPVELVDMRRELQRGNRSIFSTTLHQAIAQMQQQQRQGILFIARRGHSTFVSCRSCGAVLECPHCDVSLSYHYTHEGATQQLRCHYCNYHRRQPRHCPDCGSPYLKQFGSGTQRVALELQQQFPELHCLRFDSDTTSRKDAHRQLLGQFARGEADILVGTQMLAKGLDIAQVTLVGVIAADGLLNRADYRASEQAFQTLTQVAGRAGRGDEPGRVIIQTYLPNHPVLQAVCQHDYQQYAEAELRERQALNYPPYGQLILLRFSGVDGNRVEQAARQVAKACEEHFQGEGEILGPAPAPILRVAQRYRWQILLKFAIIPDGHPTERLTDLKAMKSLCPSTVSLSITVDPLGID